MSISCELTVYNKSGIDKSYFIFQDAPKPTDAPSGPVFANIYDKSAKIQSGHDSHVHWKLGNSFHALYGTSRASEDGNIIVDTGASLPVKLGPDGTTVKLLVDDNGEPSFDPASQPKSPAKGGFSFLTSKFKYPNPWGTYIGIGAPSPKDATKIVPIQTYVAEPLASTQLFPRLAYFVSTGDYQEGQLVNRKTFGVALRVDFTGASTPVIEIIQNNEGEWVEKKSGKVIDDQPFSTEYGVTVSVVDAAP
jgi:hypothetical protein